MILVEGDFFDGRSSRRIPAQLRVEGTRVGVHADGRELQPLAPWRDVEVSSRIGDTPRFLRFPDGATFETRDNAGVDALLGRHRPGHGLLHHLESHLRYVLVGLVIVVAFAWALVQFGIPAFSERIAFALPAEVSRSMGREVLSLLDGHVFEPSTLDAAEQARLRARFAPLTQGLRVEFRSAAKSIGPNALALPSGTIVFTDELVHLAATDEELMAVLAHEIGHVVRRHGLRQVIQGSLLSAAVVVIVGDVSSVSSMVTALPVIFTELGYSRDFEREADAHAVVTLQAHGIPAETFAAILSRLDATLRCAPDAAPSCRDHADDPRWTAYLSTHPPTAERLQWVREMAAPRPGR